jgi:hypothetical protein
MEGWLPPRAPGANPPPRFDAAPADAPLGEQAAPAPEQPRAPEPEQPGAPPGWLPPVAHRDASRPEAPPSARTASPSSATPPPLWSSSSGARDTPSSSPPRPGAARAPTSRTPYGTAVAAERNAPAVWGLVLGVTGLVLLFLSLGTLFLVTLPCSAGAWALGRRALRRIETGESRRGAGQAVAALWLGRIGVVAGVVAMVAIIVLTASGFDFENLREDLQRDLERRRDAAR